MTVPDDFTGGFTNQTPPPPAYTGLGNPNQSSSRYGTPAYGQPVAYSPTYGNQPQNGLGIASLVLGLISILLGLLVIGGILGVVAIGLGFAGRARVRQGLATNRGVATAGIITGLLGFLLSVAIVAALVVGGVKIWHSQPAKDLRQCLSSNQAAQAACEQKLGITPTPANS